MIRARGVRLIVVSFLFVLPTSNLYAFEISDQAVTKDDSKVLKIRPLQRKSKLKSTDSSGLHLQYFFMERPTLSVGGSYEENIESRTNQGESTEDSVAEYREHVTFKTAGWVYHPALLDFTIKFIPEWIQAPEGSDYLEGGEDRGYLNTYSVSGNVLPVKPYTMFLFGKKDQNSFRNVFSERAVIDTDSKGARMHLKYNILPTSLSYTNTQIKRRASLVSTQDQDIYDLTMANQTQKSVTQLNANYREILQNTIGETANTKSSDSYLRNTYFIDKKREKRLFSDFSYNWTDGENIYEGDTFWFESTNLKWSEELYWSHRENLWTNYKLSYQGQEIEDFSMETQFAGVALHHLLYENLATTIEGETSRNRYEEATDTLFKGKLNFDYTRDIPWGVVNLTTGLDAVVNNKESGDDWFWILDENHFVTSGSAIFLEQENVDETSIRITDRSGLTLYIRDQDYTIEQVGSLIRIRPTFVGNINEKDGILISYRYANVSDYEDVITGTWFGTNVFLWSTLRLSYDYYNQKQRVTKGIAPENLIDDTLHKVQARIYWQWTETTFTYENYDSYLESARQGWSINEIVSFVPVSNVQIDCAGLISKTDYKYTKEDEDAYRVSANVAWSPSYYCRTGVELYHYGISGSVQDEENSGVLAFFDLLYGGWTGSLSYRYLGYNDQLGDYDRTRQSIMFRITRQIW